VTEEISQRRIDNVEDSILTLLGSIGEDPGREGLLDTPRRVAKMYFELTSGLREPEPVITTFSRGDCNQMIAVLDINYFSICEHHLVPFYGKVHIGYIPNDQVVGLSKFGRIVDWFAKRPQIQEQFTSQISNFIYEKVKPQGVIVVVEGTHMCMSMRGVKKPNHVTVTSDIKGEIPKEEFFDLMKVRSDSK
jgi:GTP cyclohydrolase I